MKYLAAAALATAFVAAPAFAADDSVTYRVEVHGGWDRVSVGGSNGSGAVYGVGLGIDVPLGAMAFIGFEGSADLSSTKECVAFVNGPFSGRTCDEAKRDLSAVARLGANVGGGVKLYVLGGYSNARIKETSTVVFAGFPPNTTVVSGSANGDGWRVGAGAEIKLGGSAYTKLEYRYSNYEAGYERHQVLAGLGLGL